MTCDLEGHVTALILPGVGLKGEMPNLAALVKIERLDLADNFLSGSLNLDFAFLQVFDVSNNLFSGPLPDCPLQCRIILNGPILTLGVSPSSEVSMRSIRNER